MEQLKVSKTEGERLDTYILRFFPTIGIGRLNKYMRENKIKVNGKKTSLSCKVNKDDIINLYLPYTESNSFPPDLSIVYEDENILIVNKPAGLCVDSKGADDSLALRAKKHIQSTQPSLDALLCHRLDTGTSGIVLIAKNNEFLAEISSLMKVQKINKEYVCVTFGHPQQKEAILKAWLTKNAAEGIVHINDSATKNAKEIITQYKTIATSGRLALLRVNLVTGRTHQIRAQMAHISCPILGDSKYGNNAANRQYKLKYQALCAQKLSFPKIETGVLAYLSQKDFSVENPWYYKQIQDGTLR